MNEPGADRSDLLVRARSVLLDALEALSTQRAAVILIGAQAVYLHTGGIDVALAEATKDSDLAVDPRHLADHPTIESAMRAAGFFPAPSNQPGAWVNVENIPVDLMVPEALAGAGGRRGARIPPHDRRATRRARGLEAALVDHDEMLVSALDPDDPRQATVNVAGPAALLVAKLHKIAERVGNPDRLNDKDAHDVYRILRAIPTETLVARFRMLLADPISATVTAEAVEYLTELFAAAPTTIGALMAGRAEEGLGDPEQVSVATSLLADDLRESLAAAPETDPSADPS